MALFEYMKQVERFLRDARQDFLNPEDLISYINRARREVAMRAQCVRILTPISGAISSWEVTDGGSGYSAIPTLTITSPDFPSGTGVYPNGLQAEAQAIVTGGVIQSIQSTEGGAGYFQPQMTITDTTGSDATAEATVAFINVLNAGQEVYPFSSVDLSQNPGAGAVYMVKSISIIYSNYRYSLPVYAFSEYQAHIRSFPFQYQWVPAMASQYGQGVSGSFYVYPLPSQTYQYELDCFCLPQDLTDDLSVEIIPAPWTDAIPYFSAYLGYLELQNANMARFYLDQFDSFLLRYSTYARPGIRVNPYGRY